jgi:hypothetical protein
LISLLAQNPSEPPVKVPALSFNEREARVETNKETNLRNPKKRTKGILGFSVTGADVQDRGENSDHPTKPTYISDRYDDPDGKPIHSRPLPGFSPDDLIGRTFLMEPEDNGERFRATVPKIIDDSLEDIEDPKQETVKFLLSIDGE